MSVRPAAVIAWSAALIISCGLLALPLVVYAATSAVTIQNFAYSPTPVTIRVGDTVTWTNRDSAQHSAFFNDGFKTPALSQGQSASLVFGSAGTFNYVCGIHGAAMQGTVIVQAVATQAPTPPPPPPATPVPTPVPTPVRTVAPTPALTAPPTPEPTAVATTAPPTEPPTASPTASAAPAVAAASPSAVAVSLTPTPAPNETPSALLIAGAAVAVVAIGAVAWLVAHRT